MARVNLSRRLVNNIIDNLFSLELRSGGSYCHGMKRLSLLLISFGLCTCPALHAQDAATEERLNKLAGQIEDLIAGQNVLKERIASLGKEIESVREQASRPSGNYAAQEDLKRLAENLKDVDRKRIEDSERVRSELMKLGKTVAATPLPASSKKIAPLAQADAPATDKKEKAPPEKGYEYTIEKNDTLSAIVHAYREKNIKVTADQILKANPGLNANRLRPGQKIFIPAPQSLDVSER